MTWPMWAVIETAGYLQSAEKFLSEEELAAIVFFLASNPTVGDVIAGGDKLISGGDGLRKVRFAGGRGTKGGARVIYFFGGETIPLILLAAYKKADQTDLTKEQKRRLVALLPQLRARFSGKG